MNSSEDVEKRTKILFQTFKLCQNILLKTQKCTLTTNVTI